MSLEYLQCLQQLSLGEIIEGIEKAGLFKEDGDPKSIRFDFGNLCPTDIGSWRGDYSQLAIGYKEYDHKDPFASEFLKELKTAVDSYFTGWKGGEYKAYVTTPVWVANAANTGTTAISGVLDNGYEIVLITFHYDI